MSGGKSLVESLQFLGLHIENVYVKNTFLQFAQKIAGGISVDEAYEESFGRKVRPEVTMMLLVGNESGALSAMMDQISRLYFERAEKKLNRFALILQPLLLIVMGLLVGALIYTVYMPLTQLPEMLSTI